MKGLQPRHSNIPTSEYIMHGSRFSAKPTPWTSSYSYVHSNHPSSNSSTYLSGKHSPLRRGEIYLKSLPFYGSQHPSCITQHPRRARGLYPRYRCQPQPPRYSHKGANLNEQSWSCSTRGTEITGSVSLTPSAPTSSDGATIAILVASYDKLWQAVAVFFAATTRQKRGGTNVPAPVVHPSSHPSFASRRQHRQKLLGDASVLGSRLLPRRSIFHGLERLRGHPGPADRYTGGIHTVCGASPLLPRHMSMRSWC